MAILPEILSVDRLGSAEMTHSWGDQVSAFPCANDLGALRVMLDPMAVRDIMMPPYSTYGEPTALLYVNRKHAPSEGVAIGYTWYADRVERRCEMDGLKNRDGDPRSSRAPGRSGFPST